MAAQMSTNPHWLMHKSNRPSADTHLILAEVEIKFGECSHNEWPTMTIKLQIEVFGAPLAREPRR